MRDSRVMTSSASPFAKIWVRSLPSLLKKGSTAIEFSATVNSPTASGSVSGTAFGRPTNTS